MMTLHVDCSFVPWMAEQRYSVITSLSTPSRTRVCSKECFWKNSDDKTTTVLLKEVGNLKMESKEKVKDLNQGFSHILKKFAIDIKHHDSIIVDYYTSALPTNILQFIKRVAKPTLLENYKEAIIMEKDLCAIGVIKDDEPTKDFKDVSRRP